MGPGRTVGVVVEHDLADQATIGLVDRCGYAAIAVNFEQPPGAAEETVGAVLVRTLERLEMVATDPRYASAGVAMVLLHSGEQEVTVPRGVTVIPATDDALKHLREFLTNALGEPYTPTAVRLSRRELEVLTTYVLGATVEETAAAHFLAASTVRTHYRRATDRYCAAGRQVSNKTQLLLEMIADGWIPLPEHAGAVAS